MAGRNADIIDELVEIYLVGASRVPAGPTPI